MEIQTVLKIDIDLHSRIKSVCEKEGCTVKLLTNKILEAGIRPFEAGTNKLEIVER